MIVAGNWKMNLNINEAIELSNGLLKHNEVFDEEKIIIFPSFLYHRVTPVTWGRRHSLVGGIAGPTFR